MSDKISPRSENILNILTQDDWFSATDINSRLDRAAAPATLRRELSSLVASGRIEKQGDKKGTKYRLRPASILFKDFKLGSYYQQPDGQRRARETYNHDIFPLLGSTTLFTDTEQKHLDKATEQFRANAQGMSTTLHQKELERFVIEFAWKSSQIEGNTYTLLDTEFLLRNGLLAEGKSRFDATMILNHKNAYLFITDVVNNTVPIDLPYVEKLHHLLVDGLGVDTGIRNRMVGISGSLYKPLAIKQQLVEQLQCLLEVIKGKQSPYEQALIAVLGLSYLQPFEDGNKRTSRLMANSFLLRANCAPLSYRSISERDYKEACLVFYEQNSLAAFKQLFVEQYIYSATHYNIANI